MSKTGPPDSLSDKWIRAAVMTNIVENIATSLPMELKKADTVDDIQYIINTYMHDHRIGFPRGTLGPMICLTQTEQQEARQAENKTELVQTETPTTTPDSIVNAANGNRKGDGGQRKGYGQCWGCGGM